MTAPLPDAVIAKASTDCSPEELRAFVAVVREGGEVNPNGLAERVRRARLLSFARENGQLVGVAGLKFPSINHRREVEHGSGARLAADAYPFELGWVFVSPTSRGGGKSLALCTELVKREPSSGMFATSRANNVAMHRTLAKLGFLRIGAEWQSGQNPAMLWLFARASQLS
ncbi:MAG TPA: hypothetical protein VN280_16235 [Variovorax sp.]|nr:hypothetical protein [Variovorax sp.]